MTDAKFIYPTTGQKIAGEYAFEVAFNSPVPDKYYYLSHQIGHLYWPKVQLLPHIDGNMITGECNEYGWPSDGRFSAILHEVNATQHQVIQQWLSGTDFPGLTNPGVILARISLQLSR